MRRSSDITFDNLGVLAKLSFVSNLIATGYFNRADFEDRIDRSREMIDVCS